MVTTLADLCVMLGGATLAVLVGLLPLLWPSLRREVREIRATWRYGRQQAKHRAGKHRADRLSIDPFAGMADRFAWGGARA